MPRFARRSGGVLFLFALSLLWSWCTNTGLGGDEYAAAVLADGPAVYWPLDASSNPKAGLAAAGTSGETLHARLFGGASFAAALPDSERDFGSVTFDGNGGRIVVPDPGSESVLDFGRGDALTLEAWVDLDRLAGGQQVYVLGKGRTNNPGVARDNQNYALRLRGVGGTARLSFLFRNADNRPGKSEDFHRWNSDIGFVPGTSWHHVAVSYRFGEPESIRGYVDGYPTSGTWDYGGPTTKGPIVDDDELWIGSSMGGSSGSSLAGRISHVALYRDLIPAERVLGHYEVICPPQSIEDKPVPDDAVLVEIFEGVPDASTWAFRLPRSVEHYTEPAFGFVGVPNKYSERAILVDRTNPFLVHATGFAELPDGEVEVLLRARGAARLFIDDRLVLQTPFPVSRSDGHEAVHEVESNVAPNIRPLPPGDQERVATLPGDGRTHRFRLEFFVGGKKRRPELGETLVALARPGEDFQLLGPSIEVPFTDAGWEAFAAERRARLAELNTAARREAGRAEREYWNRRHELARQAMAAMPAPAVPQVGQATPVHNEIDRFLGARLEKADIKPRPSCDDWTFLRRATLDMTGTIPTPEQVGAYFSDPSDRRRGLLIDRLMDHPGWADHWTGYWQDVLAENPNILNPTLNNTGPFRWWIHESLVDNKPMDRFATELILMEGSKYFGGPGGFELATENDVPMAAKAHIVSQAFLGVEMKCARCHDAPNHPYTQKDLFSLAAMLGRAPQPVPASSTVQRSPEELEKLAITFSLKPGERVSPVWPLTDLGSPDVPAEVLRDPGDSRERLAARITSPRNRRFAKVLVNRLWQRLIGRGLREPVDDWDYAEGSHPELLDYLARELTVRDYDLKAVARLIMQSHAYQREAVGPRSEEADLFAGPVRRRMTAEQIVDSLLVASGKSMGAEELNLDVDGSRAYDKSLNLGVPCRAWQFTSLSNERDRPSLSLPGAQSVLDVLITFGWRGARQSPLTLREPEPTVLQPAILANGVMGRRMVRLSDDSKLTALALTDVSVGELVDRVFVRLLTREPTIEEREMFIEFLGPGYEERRLDVEATSVKHRAAAVGVSWSNHLSAEANQLKLDQERQVREGDPPTPRLDPGWRVRMEDMVWVLLNCPEFVFVP